MEAKIFLTAEEILEEIRLLLKDTFIATVRKRGDELELRFPGGERFTVAVWRNNAEKNA